MLVYTISSFARKDHMNQLIEPQPHTISSLDILFFYLDAAWLNEGRCPGGRPSVSEN